MAAIYLPELHDVCDTRTRDNLQEVVSSYSNGNYRSAEVMLYCTVVADIVYKIQELRDRHSVPAAQSLLQKMEKGLADHKSDWEWIICQEACRELQLFDEYLLNEISYLKSKRNSAAHPALDNNYQLISPSPEDLVAQIKTFLQQLFTQGPFISKNIVEQMVNSIAQSRKLFECDDAYDSLSSYLKSVYYSKMHDARLRSTFKALWKFCFVLTNEECETNRKINRMALQSLVDFAGEVAIEEWLREGVVKGVPISSASSCIRQAVIFFASNPQLYRRVDSETKALIKEAMRCDYGHLNWLPSDNGTIEEELLRAAKSNLSTFADWPLFDEEMRNVMNNHYKKCNIYNELLSTVISYFDKISTSYHNAEEAYRVAIRPVIHELNAEQAARLIEVIDSNDQIYPAWRICSDMDSLIHSTRQIIEQSGENFPVKNIENINCRAMEEWRSAAK